MKEVKSVAIMDKQTKDKLNVIIFGTDTPAGKAFDIILIVTILSNSILIIIESIDSIRYTYGTLLTILGWLFIGIFAIEYLLRVIIVSKKRSYIFSFFGIIDLLAILPAFLVFILPQVRLFTVVRSLRLIRLFGILKMGRYMDESGRLLRALKASVPKIIVFLFTIIFIVIIVGSIMYVIEGPQHGFDSIPQAMYWAIVTISTVGYGDLSPQTTGGKFVSSLLMIIGYGIIAVPTGIISHELAYVDKGPGKERKCPKCETGGYSIGDKFCSKCGTSLKS